MEGNVFDVFRVLSLVLVWAIPTILLLAVVVFAIATPIAILAGAVLRFYDAVRDRLRGEVRAETQPPIKAAKGAYLGAQIAKQGIEY